MTHQAPPSVPSAGRDPGRQVAQLAEALRLVERIAGRPEAPRHDQALDEAAQLSATYEAALPIIQHRFEALASETALWAAAGVEALLSAGAASPPRAAAARLAGRLDAALIQMRALLAEVPPSGAQRAADRGP